jgi:predicted metalloprotease
LYLFSLIPVSLRLQRSGLLPAVLSIVRRDWTIFRKDWTIFRKARTIFRREGTVFRKEGTVFREEGTIFREEGTVFRKARTVVGKAPTVVGKALRQIRVRMSPLPVALFYISRVLERRRPRRAPPAPPRL